MAGRPFVSGHSVNVYNDRTLSVLAEQGLRRWVMPVELSFETLAAMQAARPAGVETELFAFGRLPLAYSARCFTARAHNLPKDDCRYRCIDYPDGLALSAQDGNRFLALNGIQTQSARTFNLLGELPRIRELGVEVIRVSPQSQGTWSVVDTFAGCLDGRLDPGEGARRLESFMPAGPCDGYWFSGAGMEVRAAAAS
jgi:collagenase-like PrtC family protease